MSYRGTLTNASVCVASAINSLSGGEQLSNLYVDYVSGALTKQPDPVKDQQTATAIKMRIMNEINALSEG